MLKSTSARVLMALVAGLIAGVLTLEYGGEQALAGIEIVEAVGGLWLNALQMTVVPLVFALVVTGIAAIDDARTTGKLASRAVLLFVVLIFAAALYGVAAATGLLSLWPANPDTAAAFVASASGGPEAPNATALQFDDWLRSLAPSNPIAAAAESAVLPLVVFAVFFGFALTRVAGESKAQVVGLMRAIGETMIVIVHWVLIAAPIGVLALATVLGYRAGAGAAGILVHYMAVVSLVTFGAAVIALGLAAIWGHAPFRKFLSASVQPLLVAASTRSSLATLPVMIESMQKDLGVPARVADLILPLAVAVFRFTSPVANLAVAFYIASLYGLTPDAAHVAGAIFVAFAVSIASVGLPGQASFFASMAPICVALGVPVELLGFFLAVEIVPDTFRTIGNVAADMAATSVLQRGEEKSANPAP